MSKKLARVAPVEIQPIVIGCFTLTAKAMLVKGRPTFAEYQAVGDFIERAHKASGWWVADWLKYGESRDDWKQKIDAVMDVTGYAEQTVKNHKYIGENIAPSRRRDDVSFSVHSEVASLDPREQEHWLERAASNGWTQRELRAMIRASQRTKVIEGQAVLEGMYRVIMADCPWIYDDNGATEDGSLGKAERHYKGMTIEELCKLPVKDHALPDSVLGFWVTAPLLLESPGPREVIDAWGFRPVTQIIWDKVLGMPGRYGTHVVHEIFVICVRGSCMPDVPIPQTKSIQTIRRSNKHSEKPAEFRKILEKHWTTGPYLELFARERVDGWACFGNDARLWAEQAQGAPIKIEDDDIPF